MFSWLYERIGGCESCSRSRAALRNDPYVDDDEAALATGENERVGERRVA